MWLLPGEQHQQHQERPLLVRLLLRRELRLPPLELLLHQRRPLLLPHLNEAKREVAVVNRLSQLNPPVLLRPLSRQPQVRRPLNLRRANIAHPVNARANICAPRRLLAVRPKLRLEHQVRMGKLVASSAECPLNLRDDPAARRASRRPAGITARQRRARLHFQAPVPLPVRNDAQVDLVDSQRQVRAGT